MPPIVVWAGVSGRDISLCHRGVNIHLNFMKIMSSFNRDKSFDDVTLVFNGGKKWRLKEYNYKLGSLTSQHRSFKRFYLPCWPWAIINIVFDIQRFRFSYESYSRIPSIYRVIRKQTGASCQNSHMKHILTLKVNYGKIERLPYVQISIQTVNLSACDGKVMSNWRA